MHSTRRQFLKVSGQCFGCASGLAVFGCSTSERGSTGQNAKAGWSESIAYLENRIPELMAELRVPGASVAIVKDASVAWQRGFGVKDQASGAPLDDTTIFEAQSMSKPVFAYRVLKLCEQGVLDLDAPLTRYTPDFFVEGDSRLELITARRVLSHTTGFPDWRSKNDPLEINFTPGERLSYSGEGYFYLQSVVTRLVGRIDSAACGTYELDYRVCATDFGDYMTANLLKPFGMASSGYVWTEAIGQKLASAHDKNGQPMQRPKNTAIDVARYGSAGALLTTAADYAKFLIEMMDPKPADEYRLNAASRKEMLRPQVSAPDFPIPCSWGLGWQIWHRDNGDIIAHGGDIEGFHSQAAFSAARKSGFVILTNGENGAELIWNRLLSDLVDRFA